MYNTGGAKIFYVDGIKFHLDERTGYYGGYISKGDRKVRLHRYVWEKYNGAIPSGYHVHHKDKNKNNNEIENLVLLSSSEHLKLHGEIKSEQERELMRENIARNALPKAKEWHGSEDGIEWHRVHGAKVAQKLKNVRIEKICKCCGKSFFDNGFNKADFCGNNCKSKWRRIQGYDDETRICTVCGKKFTTNKYGKIKTCSRSCGSSLSQRTRKAEIRPETSRKG